MRNLSSLVRFARTAFNKTALVALSTLMLSLAGCGGGGGAGGGGPLFQGGGHEGTGVKQIDGAVVNQDGDFLAEQLIKILDQDGNELASTATADDGSFSAEVSAEEVSFKLGDAQTNSIKIDGAILSVLLVKNEDDGSVEAIPNEEGGDSDISTPEDPVDDGEEDGEDGGGDDVAKPRPPHQSEPDETAVPTPEVTPTPQLSYATVTVTATEPGGLPVYFNVSNSDLSNSQLQGLDSGENQLPIRGDLVFFFQTQTRHWDAKVTLPYANIEGAVRIDVNAVARLNPNTDVLQVKVLYTISFADGHTRTGTEVFEFAPPNAIEAPSLPPAVVEPITAPDSHAPDAGTPEVPAEPEPAPTAVAPRR